jgi:hypothetical protein
MLPQNAEGARATEVSTYRTFENQIVIPAKNRKENTQNRQQVS